LVERLAIDRLGARGDGVASSDAGPIYVPYTLPGEIIEADPWPGHPDRRNLVRVAAGEGRRAGQTGSAECGRLAEWGGPASPALGRPREHEA
jgi:23S rRNA (uracil1939-C5)-methyltransferase